MNGVPSRLLSHSVRRICLKHNIKDTHKMSLKTCKFGRDRSKTKGNLLGEQTTFSAVSHFQYVAFS